jgi:hypothetical protein
VTRLLLALVALLAMALVAEAVLESPAAAWAALGLFALVLLVRFELWPGRSRPARRD